MYMYNVLAAYSCWHTWWYSVDEQGLHRTLKGKPCHLFQKSRKALLLLKNIFVEEYRNFLKLFWSSENGHTTCKSDPRKHHTKKKNNEEWFTESSTRWKNNLIHNFNYLKSPLVITVYHWLYEQDRQRYLIIESCVYIMLCMHVGHSHKLPTQHQCMPKIIQCFWPYKGFCFSFQKFPSSSFDLNYTEQSRLCTRG